MPAVYTIKRNGRIVETRETFNGAVRAFWTLTAQALKNGEVADYTLHDWGAAGPFQLRRAQLPGWAADILEKHDLLEK